jgi:hypothetical protein
MAMPAGSPSPCKEVKPCADRCLYLWEPTTHDTRSGGRRTRSRRRPAATSPRAPCPRFNAVTQRAPSHACPPPLLPAGADKQAVPAPPRHGGCTTHASPPPPTHTHPPHTTTRFQRARRSPLWALIQNPVVVPVPVRETDPVEVDQQRHNWEFRCSDTWEGGEGSNSSANKPHSAWHYQLKGCEAAQQPNPLENGLMTHERAHTHTALQSAAHEGPLPCAQAAPGDAPLVMPTTIHDVALAV